MSIDRTLIRGAHVIDPAQGLDRVSDVLLNGSTIEAVGPSLPADNARVIEGSGLVAAPGFIDLHTHLREPGFEDKETIATGVLAAARGGFTTVCCMPNTEPPIDSAAIIQFVIDRARAAGQVRVLPVGAITRGRAGLELANMAELAEAGAVAFSDDGDPVSDAHLMEMALLYARDLGLPVMDHCEDRTASRRAGVHDGWVASRLGLPGYPAAAEEALIARDIALAALTDGHFHACHVSTAAGADLIRQAKARGLHVTAEVTPHHLTMSEEWVMGVPGPVLGNIALDSTAYDTRAKVSPPLRTLDDAAALAVALRDGVIDCVATDHAPHTFSDKAVPFEAAAVGISGLECAFGLLMQLVHNGTLNLALLIHRLTVAPAAVLGPSYAALATLSPGTPADLVLLDPRAEWIVDESSFASKGLNTPTVGRRLHGRVAMTIAGGNVVHDSLTPSSEGA